MPDKYSHIFLERRVAKLIIRQKRMCEKKIPPRDRYEKKDRRQKLDEVWKRNQELAAERKQHLYQPKMKYRVKVPPSTN